MRLKKRETNGPDFMGVKFSKYKIWLNLELADKRTKPNYQKKIMRSFRLSPEAIKKLESRIKETGLSGADLIESLL